MGVLGPLGAMTAVQVRIDGASDRTVRIVIPADTAVAVDDQVAIRILRDRVHVFDERTGVAVRPP